MPEIYLIRHAHVDYAPPAQITAHNPLTPLGHQMAQRLAMRCDDWALEHLFVSSMLRAQQTAAPILARYPEMPRTVMDDLRETGLDDLAGMVGPLPGEDLHTWDLEHFAEGNRGIWPRIQRGLAEIERVASQRGLDRVGVVSHGAAINAMIRQWQGESVEDVQGRWIDLNWCAVSCLRYKGDRRTVPWINDASHVADLLE